MPHSVCELRVLNGAPFFAALSDFLASVRSFLLPFGFGCKFVYAEKIESNGSNRTYTSRPKKSIASRLKDLTETNTARSIGPRWTYGTRSVPVGHTVGCSNISSQQAGEKAT